MANAETEQSCTVFQKIEVLRIKQAGALQPPANLSEVQGQVIWYNNPSK